MSGWCVPDSDLQFWPRHGGPAQGGVVGVEFVVALIEDQSLHVCTCQVSFRGGCILINFYLNFIILTVHFVTFY